MAKANATTKMRASKKSGSRAKKAGSLSAPARMKTGAGRSPAGGGEWANQVVRAVWPQERDFFERPERYRYVRKLIKTDGCVFCEANRVGIGVDSLVLAQDDQVMVVMNKYPYNTGHLLVLPREHIGNIWDLSEKTNARLAFWLKAASRILTKELGCHGLNLGMNHGAVAGAGIPEHLHWHIVPRWGGDTNFFPLIAETKVLPETLTQTYARLKPHFDKE
jgi:ATP adenylyltransferase